MLSTRTGILEAVFEQREECCGKISVREEEKKGKHQQLGENEAAGKSGRD